LSATGAKVEVSRGEASFAVRHQQRTNWLVGAGPYHVRVTGTRFAVSWAPASEHFQLHLEQGSVVGTADPGPPPAVATIAPQRPVIDHKGWKLASPTEAAGPNAPALPEPPEPPTAPAGLGGEQASPPAARLTQPSKWESLAHAGSYGDAYQDAAQHGI